MTSGAWKGSDRKSRLPSHWPVLRKRVIERAGGQCEMTVAHGRCPSRGTDVDHIVAGDDHSMANLQLLCLAPEAPVLMANHGFLPVSEVEVGDFVLSPDLQPHRVVQVHRRHLEGELLVVGGLRLTPEHLVLTRQGWTPAAFLVPNSQVFVVVPTDDEVDGEVVEAVPIEVMHALFGQQGAPEHDCCDETMFEDVSHLGPQPQARVPLARHLATSLVERLWAFRQRVEPLQPASVRASLVLSDQTGEHLELSTAHRALLRDSVDLAALAQRAPAVIGAGARLGAAPGRPEHLAADLARPLGQGQPVPRAGWVALGEIRRVAYSGFVHDITVAGSHSYVAGSVSVHNCYWHHKKKSSAEGVQARRLPPIKRAAEKHPGER